MILIDLKMVELTPYEGIPQFDHAIITQPKKPRPRWPGWSTRWSSVPQDMASRVRHIDDFNDNKVRSGAITAPLGSQREYRPHPLRGGHRRRVGRLRDDRAA